MCKMLRERILRSTSPAPSIASVRTKYEPAGSGPGTV
jgi:hypothetical protein